MAEALARANAEYTRSSGVRFLEAERAWGPIIDLLTLTFDLQQVHSTADAQSSHRALSRYTRTINPVVDLTAMLFGISELKPLTGRGFAELRTSMERNVVEGALISIENDTGFITAIVGGSRFDETNQLIRASQANVQPGSAFKPLYYSAAIDSRQFTASTRISDLPIVFHNEDGTPYMPMNFMDRWHGQVLFTDALAQSLNVASVRILDAIGFDAAIDRSAVLLNYTSPDEIRRRFPRVFPLGLGINTTSPLRMARAFAIFANQGREVTPIAIRSIEDRNGRMILDLERELRLEQRRRGDAAQLVSPQNAYIMTAIMRRTVEIGPNGHGTLYNPSGWGSKFTFRDEGGRTFRMPMAGKTGTPQNWSDAWTVGYSPYYTTAVWFGFDRPGNSLGVNLTGSALAGPVWADYMREIHHGLPFRDFVRPRTGLIDVTVCARSGLLRNPSCNRGEMTLTFLEGTQPVLLCDDCGGARGIDVWQIERNSIFFDSTGILNDLTMPALRDELLLQGTPVNQPRAGTGAPPASVIPEQRPAPGIGLSLPTASLLNDLLIPPPLPDIIPEPIVELVDEEQEPVNDESGLPDDDDIEQPAFNPFLD
jgi:penicillin-binding protein 1A